MKTGSADFGQTRRTTAAIRCGASSRGSGRSSACGTFCFVTAFAAWDAKAAPTLRDAKRRIAAPLGEIGKLCNLHFRVDLMYRFRKTRHLIDYNEIENQEIYFSDLSSLNDPMEGFRNYYWKGDNILWENLFKHYLLCLESTISLALVIEEDYVFSETDIPIFIDIDKLPTQIYKNMIQEIYDSFFKTNGISDFINYLSSRQSGINKDELYFYLRMIHLSAIKIISEVHINHNLQPKPDNPFPLNSDPLSKFIPLLQELQKIPENEQNKYSTLISIFNSFMNEFDLNLAQVSKNKKKSNKQYFIISDFTSTFIKQIDKITYPESYVTCFMEDCTNPVVWSHYGDNHRGVALKFNVEKKNNELLIELFGITGFQINNKESNFIKNKRNFSLKKISYTNDYPKLNFFKSLGHLSMGSIIKHWYSDEKQNKTNIYDEVIENDMNTWRKEYWDLYLSSFLIKLKSWEYENEYRIILPDAFDLYNQKDNRKFKYDFQLLDGIVFGMKTPFDTKLKIIEIIKNKCIENNRNDFKFYQMYYDDQSNDLRCREMKMLDLQ